MATIVDEYLLDLKNRTAPKTLLAYKKDIILFLSYFAKKQNKEYEDITLEDIKNISRNDILIFFEDITEYDVEYLTRAGKLVVQKYTNSNSGKMRKLASIRSFFSYFIATEQIKYDPTSLIKFKIKHNNKIKERIEKNEIKQLIQVIDDVTLMSPHEQIYADKLKDRNKAMILILLYTGIRISELVNMNVKDLKCSRGYITVKRKGGKFANIELPTAILSPLKQYQEIRKEIKTSSDALFLSLQKRRIHPRTVSNLLSKCENKGSFDVHITPHTLRRTFGNNHYNTYKDISLTAKELGHSSSVTTEKFYVESDEQRRKEAMKNFDY